MAKKKQITEEQIEQLVERLIDKMQKANELLLTNIGEKIKKIRDLKPTEAHKLIQTLKYGGNYEEIIKKLTNVANMTTKELDDIFVAYSKKDLMFAEDFFKYRDIPFYKYNRNSELKRQTESLSRMAKNVIYDLTREKVLGFSVKDKKGNLVFKGIKEIYNDMLDTAFMNVGQGKETFDNAMRSIMKEIGQSGLKTIDYKSGRSVRLDSAIRMHLRNRLNELHNENQILFGRQFKADGIEISVHENPAPDHEDVQGRQFNTKRPSPNVRSEWEKLQDGDEATDYKGNSYTLDLNGNGSYRPIGEMNCYHTVFSIILGVSEPEYSDKELQDIKARNDKGFEFEGKHYTMYEGTQLQRQIEREIRKQKDLQLLGKASGDKVLIGDAQERITILNYKYKDLSDTSGLPTRKNRLTVGGYKRVNLSRLDNYSLEPVADLNYGTPVQPKEMLLPVKDNKFYKSSRIFKASKDYLDLSNNDNIKIYNATDKLNIDIYERANIKKCWYNRWQRKIQTTSVIKDDLDPQSTLWHELGHALDNNKGGSEYLSNTTEIRTAMYDYYSNNREIPQRVKDYFTNYKNEFKSKAFKEFEEQYTQEYYYDNFNDIALKKGFRQDQIEAWYNTEEAKRRSANNWFDNDKYTYFYNKKKTSLEYQELSNLSDIFSATSKGEYNGFLGNFGYHTKKYFVESVEHPTTEAFADFVSLKMTGQKKHLDFLKSEIPELYDELEKVYKQIGDDLNGL